MTGIGNDCELEIKGNYTRNSESDICLNFVNTWGRSNDVLLKCRKQCMTQHRITIEQNGKNVKTLFSNETRILEQIDFKFIQGVPLNHPLYPSMRQPVF